MIRTLKALFERYDEQSAHSLQHGLKLAAAALLIETARANFTQSVDEMNRITELLGTSLRLTDEEVRALVAGAQEHVDAATSLYEFTQTIDANCNRDQKLQLIRAMWLVAYADGNVDKYEEHLIRRVANLLHVPHLDYIQCKLDARA